VAPARAYLHALHHAGIELTVVDLAGNRARQVEDPLVASLVGRKIDADYHLFSKLTGYPLALDCSEKLQHNAVVRELRSWSHLNERSRWGQI